MAPSGRRAAPTGRALTFALAVSGTVWLVAPRFGGFLAGSAGADRLQLRSRTGLGHVAATARGAGMTSPSLADTKAKLLDLLDDSSLEGEVLRPEGKPMRGRVDEAIIGLERLNAETEPVYSTLLDGTWNVKYAGSYAPGLLSSPTRELALFLYGGGFSLGNALNSFTQGFWGQSVGVKLGSRKVEIQGGRDVSASAEVEVGGRKDKLLYKAELMPLSASRMSEEVVSVMLPDPIGSQDLPFELRRSILVTYLDEEMMIVRDESGVPEVLMREFAVPKPKPFSASVASNATKTEMEDYNRALDDAASSDAA
ncbi:unnamed protein product [Polarella glacialis]|uniref:Plastid lipid-associated protein/fibrillin conserved domain-containing protein n=1 Tax=Polarella glacialis TaxID=89957 RepID=A0A813GRX4_POLGL|nr:unnamed protein product [Polarella glacialis]